MATQKKIELVDEYSRKFKDSKSIFLAEFGGIDVEDTNELRRSFRNANVQYRVIKNTLAKRSLENAGIDGLTALLSGMTAFAYSDEDPVAPIKVIQDFNKKRTKEQARLVVKGCVFEGQVMPADKAENLAELPTRDVLMAQLLGMLQSPLQNMLGALQGAGRKLVGVLESVKNQKT